MSKYPKMTHYPLPTSINGEIFEPEKYDKCIQVEVNKDGSIDTYDFKTCKHLERY